MEVVDHTLTLTIEIPNEMNKGTTRARTSKPRLSKHDGFAQLGLLFLDKQHLLRSESDIHQSILNMIYLFHLLAPFPIRILAFGNRDDHVPLYSERLTIDLIEL